MVVHLYHLPHFPFRFLRLFMFFRFQLPFALPCLLLVCLFFISISLLFGHCRSWLWPMRMLVSTFLLSGFSLFFCFTNHFMSISEEPLLFYPCFSMSFTICFISVFFTDGPETLFDFSWFVSLSLMMLIFSQVLISRFDVLLNSSLICSSSCRISFFLRFWAICYLGFHHCCLFKLLLVHSLGGIAAVATIEQCCEDYWWWALRTVQF